MHKRGFVSFLTLAGFLFVLASGIVLYVTPHGWAARGLGWTLLGLDKYDWINVHVAFSALWLIAVSIHIYLNWRVLKAFAYKKAAGGFRLKREMALAALIMLAVFLGSLYQVTPFNYLTSWGEAAKLSWLEDAGPGAYQARGRGRNLLSGESHEYGAGYQTRGYETSGGRASSGWDGMKVREIGRGRAR